MTTVILPLASISIVLAVLVVQLAVPRAWRAIKTWEERETTAPLGYDQGRELRAEQRARELLRSCVNQEEWEMYRDLGFIRVWGALSGKPRPDGESARAGGADYAYLIYPHRPIIAYLPQTATLLNEYCVAFPDRSRPYGSMRLPASDDVLAKWMALTADERRLVAEANMHLPGRQVDPKMVRGDLGRLARWERERLGGRRSGVVEDRALAGGIARRGVSGA